MLVIKPVILLICDKTISRNCYCTLFNIEPIIIIEGLFLEITKSVTSINNYGLTFKVFFKLEGVNKIFLR